MPAVSFAGGGWWAWAIAVCLSIINHQSPIANPQEIPPFGQPQSDFYGAAGNGVKVAWKLDRTEVPENGEIVATLVVTNATNPTKITRPDLKSLREFHDLFVIADNADPPAVAGAKEVTFSYRLRPRNRETKHVPTFKFYYFNPAAPEGKKQFPMTRTDEIPITVTAAPQKPPPPPEPMTEPDHLFAVATGPGLLDRPTLAIGSWTWWLVGLGAPLAALVWYAAWRRVYPGAHRLARIRRSRAARRATELIRRAGRTPDPPAAVAAAVLGYLRARFPLPPAAITPPEIGAGLAELDVPAADCDAVADFFRKCDAARFAPSSDGEVSLASEGGALITRLEAA